jgi:hypothetical protein
MGGPLQPFGGGFTKDPSRLLGQSQRCTASAVSLGFVLKHSLA